MNGSEALCNFVCSRGLLKSCDYHSNTPQSSTRRLINYQNITIINNKPDSEISTIYVCSSAIPHFITAMLPNISNKIILVSGDCDEDIPNDIFRNKEDFDAFVNNDKLVHWFCQNWLGGKHKKVTNMPIGLDYHTMASRQIFWGPITSPSDQERLLVSLKNKSKPFWEREIKCYSNFHFLMTTKHGYDRKDAYENIPNELVFYEENRVKRLISWNNQIKYAFVISPHGNGKDCHRTWEALALGCIPIVKTSELDVLYIDLPVLIVSDWRDVTYELLENTVNKFKGLQFDYSRITMKYWIDKINAYKTIE